MGKKFTISFAGDTSLGEWYLRKPGKEHLVERLENNPLSFFEGVKPLIEKSDYFILNLETVLEENPKPVLEGKEYPNYDNPDRTLGVLKDLGVTAVGLANNHTMDFGPEILLRTKQRLEEVNIKTFGAGESQEEAIRPLQLTLEGENSKKDIYIFTGMKAGKRYREDYGFFADKTKPGINALSQKRMTKEIKKLRKQDPESIIIVYPHWQGQDYKWASKNEKIQERSRAFIDAGANYIFGHGPHMLNDIEMYHGGTITYSIGNFIFNSPGRYQKLNVPPYSLIVNMEIKEKEDGSWEVENKFYPIITDNKKTEYSVSLIKKEDQDFTLRFPGNNFFTQRDLLYLNNLHIDLDKKENQMKKTKNIFEILEYKDISDITQISDEQEFNYYIESIKELSQYIDEKYKVLYEGLNKSRYMKANKLVALKSLGPVIDKNYISHSLLRKFEKNNIVIEKSFSFKEIVMEKSRLKKLGYPEYSWKLDKKINAYHFADRVGFRRPKTYPGVYTLEQLPKIEPPIVIKPMQSTGSRGVYLIFNNNKILSVDGVEYLNSWEEMKKDARRRLNAKSRRINRDEWIIEELILENKNSEKATTNFKFNVFYGEVLFVQEETPEHWHEYCFWDENMNNIKIGKYEDQFYMGKGFNKKDLDKVKELSLKIPSPFVRIDTLVGMDELVLGELTPRIGKFHTFNEEWDKKLGRAYMEAEARLIRDLVGGKKFPEFTEVFNL